MDDVSDVARDALAQVRRAVSGIRAAGLAAELASARLLLESDGVRFSYELGEVALPAEQETVLALAVREAVTNIQRHARAGRRVGVGHQRATGRSACASWTTAAAAPSCPAMACAACANASKRWAAACAWMRRAGQGTRLETCCHCHCRTEQGPAPPTSEARLRASVPGSCAAGFAIFSA